MGGTSNTLLSSPDRLSSTATRLSELDRLLFGSESKRSPLGPTASSFGGTGGGLDRSECTRGRAPGRTRAGVTYDASTVRDWLPRDAVAPSYCAKMEDTSGELERATSGGGAAVGIGGSAVVGAGILALGSDGLRRSCRGGDIGLRGIAGRTLDTVGGEIGVRSEVVLALSKVLLLMMLAAVLEALERDPRRLGRVSAILGRMVDSEGKVLSVASEGKVLSVGSEGNVDMDVIEGSEAIEVDAIVEL